MPELKIFILGKKKVGGRFYGYVDIIEAGSYSDDTQLLLSVARSIKKNWERSIITILQKLSLQIG